MYKVMLIEDEPPILHMVKDMIEASPQGFAVAHAAFNGRKALLWLEETGEKPDLIVTDIRMPVMDGLQFMRELSARGYDIPCIVLSGYSDFNYAREALQHHAFDYLLKPLKEEHLEQALAKAAALLVKSKEERERRFLKHALRLMVDSESDCANPGFRSYQLVLIRIGNHQSDEWEASAARTRGWRSQETGLLKEIVASGGGHTPSWRINGLTSNETVIIRGLANPVMEALKPEEAKGLHDRCRRIREAAPTPVSVAVSAPVDTAGLAASYRLLRETLACEVGIGESKVWLQGEAGQPNFELSTEMEQACRTVAKSNDYRSFEKAMAGWKEEWKREGYGQTAVENLLSTVVRLFRAQRQGAGLPAEMTFHANELVFDCETPDEAAQHFCAFMKEEFNRLSGLRQGRSAKDLIDKVRHYLEQHYMDPIGSDTLQQLFGYHKTYISNVFSEVVGIPPSKYLVKLRMDKAIALLNERSDLSLRQVAEQVGYEDSLYFSKVFKNATGLSPSEYKERRERK